MVEILRRFYTTEGRHEIVREDGEYFYCVICAGKVMESVSFDNFESAERKFCDALCEAHRTGARPEIDEDFCDEIQHVNIEEDSYEALDESARTLPTAPEAAPKEEKSKASPEVLENPHYAAQKVQPIDLIETLGASEFVGFLRGNIIKYTARAGKKSGEPAKKEARKALWYALRWYIEVGGSRDDVTAVLNEMEW